MYIPYDIWDEVYFFHESGKLNKAKITQFIISEEKILVNTDWIWDYTLAQMLPLNRIYPTKALAKEELLRRAINYANEKLIDL